MKLKINKACDLNSISVLPPHSRRPSIMAQTQLQPSQQSFSQGFSSQQTGVFSQISQNSHDEAFAENQRFSSQEKDNSLKRVPCLAPISYPRQESQVPISRSSTNIARRWSSATVPNHKYLYASAGQQSDELEYRIAMMETSLSRIGMVLDSIQADVMQVNKGTKELSLEVEGMHQKLLVYDDSLHQLNRGHADTRASLDVGFKSISDQLSKITQQDKLEQILSAIFNLPERIDTNVQKRNCELSECLSGDLQAITCSLKALNQKSMALAILPPKVTGADSTPNELLLRRENKPRKMSKEAPLVPKIEMGSWTTVKAQQVTSTNRSGSSCDNLKQKRPSRMNRDQKTVIELDEGNDGDLSCFIVEEKLDSHLVDEEAARILRLARRRKRKQNNRTFMTTCRKK